MGITLDLLSSERNPLYYLFGSTYRVKILQELHEEAGDPRKLKDRLEIPRSSLHRTIQELESKGWITRNGSVLKIEPLGEYVFTLYSRIEPEIYVVTIATKVSKWITLDMEYLPMLYDCEVHLRDGRRNPLETVFDWIEENNQFKGYFSNVPTLFSRFLNLTPEIQLNASVIYLSQNRISKTEYTNLERTFDGDLNWTSYDLDFSILFSRPESLLIGMDSDNDVQTVIQLSNDQSIQFGEDQFQRIQGSQIEND